MNKGDAGGLFCENHCMNGIVDSKQLLRPAILNVLVSKQTVKADLIECGINTGPTVLTGSHKKVVYHTLQKK